jgi:UDP-N-acetylmuramoyl-L-alanyl-D-glutamate--2,6-diaminopimelate ligase
VAGLGAARPVTGRFEVLPGAGPFTVVVDYAHTPDGLRSALDSARRLAGAHRVLCVFGCGGERDHDKRPAMGAVAATLADVAVLTSDNPRHEDPAAIIADVLVGVADRSRVVVRPERAEAIDLAVDMAGPGDVVLVAGKGHETVIDYGDRRIPFDDAAVAGAALERRFGPSTSPGAPR